MKVFPVLLALFVFSGIFTQLSAQGSRKEARKIEKEKKYQELLELIGTERYLFRGDWANPQGAQPINLTTRENFLKIDHGIATADLPYFGRAFSSGYSGGGGIEFESSMETYEVIKDDKKYNLTVKFTVRGKNDTFNCTLTASDINSASLSVISNKRQTIGYSGKFSALETSGQNQ